jgi:hypothetical protein
VLFLLLSTPHSAWSEDQAPTQDFSVLGGMGATSGEHGAGVEFDLAPTYSISIFEIGVEARASGWFPTVTMISLGGVAGIAFGDPWSVHLWGAGGVHLYEGVGGTLGPPLGYEDPGVSAVLPYLGGRALLGYAAGDPRDRTRFFGGVMGLFDRDLNTITRNSTYQVSGLERVEPHEVGQWMGGVFLVAGVTLGL